MAQVDSFKLFSLLRVKYSVPPCRILSLGLSLSVSLVVIQLLCHLNRYPIRLIKKFKIKLAIDEKNYLKTSRRVHQARQFHSAKIRFRHLRNALALFT